MSSLTDDPKPAGIGLGRVQRRRKIALFIAAIAAVVALPFVTAIGSREHLVHEVMEIAGLVLIVGAILGRSWCTLYIGGRKSLEIVSLGPYSISRNPLYVFSLVGIFGIGAQTGSLLLGPVLAAVGFAIFLPVVLREEKVLADRFEQSTKFIRRASRVSGRGCLTGSITRSWSRGLAPFGARRGKECCCC